jgi:beta-glucosidase/6-phospho-beta-glucosidase/beta-galactosidase
VVSGKGEDIWDRMQLKHPDWIADGLNGDIAADCYHRYKEGVMAVRKMWVSDWS